MIDEKMVRDYIDNLTVILNEPCDHGDDIIAAVECVMRKAHIIHTIQLMTDILDPPEQMLEAMKNSAHAALEIKKAEKVKEHGEPNSYIWGAKPSSN